MTVQSQYTDEANRLSERAMHAADLLSSEMSPEESECWTVAERIEAGGRALVDAGLRAVQIAEGLRASTR